MNVTRESIDALNAVIKIDVVKDDYSEKMDKVFKDYKKKTNIPGFRKGHVPMSLVKKQIGEAVKVEELNKLVQETLFNYLQEEKIDYLGNPLPKINSDFDWKNDDFTFEFELGYSPQIEVNLKTKKAIKFYDIFPEDKMIADEIDKIRKNYGELIAQDSIGADSEIKVEIEIEEKELKKEVVLEYDKLAKKIAKSIKDQKAGYTFSSTGKEFYKNTQDLNTLLNVSEDLTDDSVKVHVLEINKREPAELNEEMFKKITNSDAIKTESDLSNWLKDIFTKQYQFQSEQKFLDDYTTALLEQTKFDLPDTFLKKWLLTVSKEPVSEKQVEEEYENTQKSFRYQLIEEYLLKDNNIVIDRNDLEAQVSQNIKNQFKQYGLPEPEGENLQSFVAKSLADEKQVNQLSQEVKTKKLLALFKEKGNLKTEKISVDNFMKKVYP